jgi:pyrroloquinoline-quinone synthase
MLDLDHLISKLDAATSERRLLDHSFYQAWAAGELTSEDLAHYSTQYWRQVEAFPGCLEKVSQRIDDEEARKIVLENLSDEVEQDHPSLWLDFAVAVGKTRADVTAAPVEPETAHCVENFSRSISEETLPFALGMLYGYESQTPAVAETKVAGLRDHYGIDGPGVEYFRLHGVLDVEHSREMAAAIARVSGEDIDDAVEGARRGADAIWGLLDGVERVRTSK